MTAPGAELVTLETLDDAQLQDVMRRAGELLRERERAKQREAIEQARSILAGAGLSVQDMLGSTGKGRGPRKGANGSAAAAPGAKRARYANPANPAQVYEKGRGREPNWFKELRERGEVPAPLE